jgi:predicted anti-sigma-YlaC factor YlaD
VSALTCEEFVELVTDYLEGALDRETEGRFAHHATECDGCQRYLDQIRETMRMVGRLTPEALDPQARDALLLAFRDWSALPHREVGDA